MSWLFSKQRSHELTIVFDFFLLQIDLLHGISVAVGRRFREECDRDSVWQGLFQKEDIIQLTKLVKTKSGGSLYTKIAEEQAAIQVSASTVLKLQDQCNSGQTIDELRKILPPGYFASKRKVTLAAKFPTLNEEFWSGDLTICIHNKTHLNEA